MDGEEALKKLIKDVFRPTILVKTTPDVEKIMAKNGMKFIDLLRPCEVIKKDSLRKRKTKPFLNLLS